MFPPRRRSARLAEAAPKPKAGTKTPSKLLPVSESRETDESDSASNSHPTPSNLPATPHQEPSTPRNSSTAQPSVEQMHPGLAHHSTTAAPSSVLRLGFSEIKHIATPLQNTKYAALRATTPSKSSSGVPSSAFTFTLSSDGQKLREEIQAEATKIKAELIAQREKERAQQAPPTKGRKIAHARGKSSRFSAAHMAEFRKMDSIAGHASSFRALQNRTTPQAGLKRSPSKANLDDSLASAPRPTLKRTQSRAKLDEPVATTPAKQRVLKSPSKEILRGPPTIGTPNRLGAEPVSPAKRFKQRVEDDASSSRPTSRDASSIPRPKSRDARTPASLRGRQAWGRLTSPTKASLVRAAVPTPRPGPTVSLVKSPSRPNLLFPPRPTAVPIPKDVEKTPASSSGPSKVVSPSTLSRVKSILKGKTAKLGSALPMPSTSNTTEPNLNKALPAPPMTTPRRRLVKRVDTTPASRPMSTRGAVPSPSPVAAGLRGRRLSFNEPARVDYPSLDSVVAATEKDDIQYPDLSRYRDLSSTEEPPATRDEPTNNTGRFLPPSVPGTFTFRSDHTINFGSTSPNGFGASPGQVSLRHIRPSILHVPGSFDASVSSHPNKENVSHMKILPGIRHGITNKRRRRVSTDEEDDQREAEERLAKKQKSQHVPEGSALLAPRLMATPSSSKMQKIRNPNSAARTPASSSPKKASGLSMARLNMLARPKNRV